ncbi:hypothetical protein [Roseovarius albus]|nr:hypothetical protein [Roseovarius albus]
MTPDKLTLEDRPRLMAGFVWFMGLACIYAALSGQTRDMPETILVTVLGVGAFVLAHYFFPFQRLSFDCRSGQFTREVARVTGRLQSKIPLTEIERVAVQAQWSDNSRMERLVLIKDRERVPLEYGFTSSPREQMAKDINAWLARC